jgi:uncharacterized protein
MFAKSVLSVLFINRTKAESFEKAILSNEIERVRSLLRSHPDLAVSRLSLGEAPLLYASRQGLTEVVVELVEAGADLLVADDEQNTALLLASSKGHTEVGTGSICT